MKHLPNILTSLRIMLSVCLTFTEPLGTGFFIMYLICGATDMLDGPIARKYKAATEIGARLDSAADFIFIVMVIIRLYPVIILPATIIVWIGLIAVVRFIAAAVAKLRFGKFGFLHTYGNKLTGLLLFCYPLSLLWTNSLIVLFILCAIATLSAIEELAIELLAKQWNATCKTLFHCKLSGLRRCRRR